MELYVKNLKARLSMYTLSNIIDSEKIVKRETNSIRNVDRYYLLTFIISGIFIKIKFVQGKC